MGTAMEVKYKLVDPAFEDDDARRCAVDRAGGEGDWSQRCCFWVLNWAVGTTG